MKTTPARAGIVTASLLLQTAALADSPAARVPLDLKITDITQLFSPEELRAAIGTQQTGVPEIASVEQLDTVIVETPDNTVVKAKSDLPLGFAAMAWGVQHPTQLWRLFLPVTFSETR